MEKHGSGWSYRFLLTVKQQNLQECVDGFAQNWAQETTVTTKPNEGKGQIKTIQADFDFEGRMLWEAKDVLTDW